MVAWTTFSICFPYAFLMQFIMKHTHTITCTECSVCTLEAKYMYCQVTWTISFHKIATVWVNSDCYIRVFMHLYQSEYSIRISDCFIRVYQLQTFVFIKYSFIYICDPV